MNYKADFEQDLIDGKPLAKKIKHSMVCPDHKKRVNLSYDFDDYGANAYIVKYCCFKHAEAVQCELQKISFFNRVEIENND